MAPTTSSLVPDDRTDANAPATYDDNAHSHPCDPGENPFQNDAELADAPEWTMLLRLNTMASAATVNIVKIHRTLFELLQTADPTMYFKTVTGTKLSSSHDFPKGTTYESTFKHKETRKTFIVAHTVGSSKSIDELKRHNLPLLSYLKEHNVFLDKSVSGSLTEVVLGPWFGIHPDLTSKDRLRFDLVKLICCHGNLNGSFYDKIEQAKAALPFPGTLPPFQLRTRRIQRTVDAIEYSAKTTSFICAAEHRTFWEAILVDGISSGWLAPLGRFYLLQRDDHSEDLISGIIWHNRMLTNMKAVIIRGIHTHVMDAAVRAPHSMEERPTLREQIHKGGFITIISTKDRSKWIGIAQNSETASNWVNNHVKQLCASVYKDGTDPVASDPEPKPRQHRQSHGQSDEKSALFDRQSRSWADISRLDNDEDSGNYTSSNIAKRIPAVVRFASKVHFDITEVAIDTAAALPEANDETIMSNTDGLTNITQDDLRSMKDELCAQFKDELSTAISEMSSADARSSNEQFQESIKAQITLHNQEMHETMKSMRLMMSSMQLFVESTLTVAKHDSDSSRGSIFHDSRLQQSDDDSPVTRSDSECPDSPMLTQPQSKRKSSVSKGESPASKLAHTRGGRNGGRGRGGRWETTSHHSARRSSRTKTKPSSFDPSDFDAHTNNQFDPMEVSASTRPGKNSSLARNLADCAFTANAPATSNSFDPLAESAAPSPSGSN
jgi:hypothetical protein